MRVNDVMALSLHVMSSKEIKLQRLRLLRWLVAKSTCIRTVCHSLVFNERL